MARPLRIDSVLVEHARDLAARAEAVEPLRSAQAVLLPALLGATLEQTAVALGVGRATVGRHQARVRRRLADPTPPPQRGGRRHAALSVEEEREFLAPWVERSADGNMPVVAPLRAALAQRLERAVTHSVVYRLLARHGWRKVAPDTRHPKSDPAAQAQWKKTARRAGDPPRTRSRACAPGATDVSRRGALRAHGCASAAAGPAPACDRRCATAMNDSSSTSMAPSAPARDNWTG